MVTEIGLRILRKRLSTNFENFVIYTLLGKIGKQADVELYIYISSLQGFMSLRCIVTEIWRG